MKKKFDEEFPTDGEDFDSIPDELKQTDYENTVELSNEGVSQNMVQEMNKNQLIIAKLKLKLLTKEKKEIKTYIKNNLLNKGIKGLIKIVEGK